MPLGDASAHRGFRAVDFSLLTPPSLSKHGKEDDSSTAQDEVAHAHSLPTEIEAQLAKLAAQLPGVGLAQMNTLALE